MKYQIIYRDAVTGQTVTANYAKKNPETTVKEKVKIKPKAAIEILRAHQKWRRGADIEMISPKQIGLAIDEILEYLD